MWVRHPFHSMRSPWQRRIARRQRGIARLQLHVVRRQQRVAKPQLHVARRQRRIAKPSNPVPGFPWHLFISHFNSGGLRHGSLVERLKFFIINTLGIGANTAVPVLVDRSGVLSGKTVISLVPGNTHTLALAASPPPPSNNADLASLGSRASPSPRRSPVARSNTPPLFRMRPPASFS